MPFWDKLEDLLPPDIISSSQEEKYVYRTDSTKYKGEPDLVVNVTNQKEVLITVNFAAKNEIPIIPRGAGSGMSGGAVPVKGGIVLNFEKMNKILKIDKRNRIAYVQPGVVVSELQEKVKEMGLYYPPDPSSNKVATIGGTIAENAGGLHCVRYGVTSRYVKGLKFVDSTGYLYSYGIFSNKSLPGASILIGSEGTLGIITEIALELLDEPILKDTFISYHSSFMDAVDTVIKIKQTNIDPSVMEIIDNNALNAVTQFKDISLLEDTDTVLIIQLDSNLLPDLLYRSSELENLFKKLKILGYKKAESNDEAESIWDVRRAISSSIKRISPNKLNEDISIPVSEFPRITDLVRNIGEKYGLRIVIYGHAGDGNLHINILYDKDDKSEVDNTRFAAEEIFKSTVQLGGSITGEHGIGLSKKTFLSLQYSKDEIGFMKKLKKAFDPDLIINPDKIFNVQREN
ncbi:MAG: FAD-binding protein [Candidatus Delongbacteria bacterium]|jgi:glycolate oxidase|nr:FAD-binding protein [Candidatus Delongbacteria bacterium]